MLDRVSDYEGAGEYISFRYREYDFLISIANVREIVANVPEDACVIGDADYCYILSEVNNTLIAISVDEIYDLEYIENSHQMSLPEATRSVDNEWIIGAAYRGEDKDVAFLIDCNVIAQRANSSSVVMI